jgi:hypothetical protein
MVVLSLGTPRPPEWRDQNIFIGLVLHIEERQKRPKRTPKRSASTNVGHESAGKRGLPEILPTKGLRFLGFAIFRLPHLPSAVYPG